MSFFKNILRISCFVRMDHNTTLIKLADISESCCLHSHKHLVNELIMGSVDGRRAREDEVNDPCLKRCVAADLVAYRLSMGPFI